MNSVEREMLFSAALSRLETSLVSAGYSIHYGNNLEKYHEFHDGMAESDKLYVGHQWHSRLNTYLRSDFLYIIVTNSEDEVVCTATGRINDLDEMSLLDHWKEFWPRIYAEFGYQPRLEEPIYDFAAKISGRVAYVGDLWVREDYRVKGLGRVVGQLVQVLAQKKFNAGLVYAFIPWRDFRNALEAVYGWGFRRELLLQWGNTERVPKFDLWYVANSRDDIDAMVYLLAKRHEEVSHRLLES